MSEFSSLLLKTQNLLKSNTKVKISGLELDQFSFIFQSLYGQSNLLSNLSIIVCSTEEEAESLYDLLKPYVENIFFYPGLSQSPFSSVIQSENSLNQRHKVLKRLTSKNKSLVVLSVSTLFLKVPPSSFYNKNTLSFEVSDILSPDDLAQALVKLGYSPTPTIEEPGTFSKKGEIFDIYPLSQDPIRIHYFDDMIEEIFKVDKDTLKTIRDSSFEKFEILNTPKSIFESNLLLNFRGNLDRPAANFKQQHAFRNNVFGKLNSGILFENYPLYYPLFFNETQTLLNYIDSESVITFYNYDQALTNMSFLLEEMEQIYTQNTTDEYSDYILPKTNQVFETNLDLSSFKQIIFESVDIEHSLDKVLSKIPLTLESTRTFYQKNSPSPKVNKFEFIKDLFSVLKQILLQNGSLVICYKHDTSKDELKYLLEENELLPRFDKLITFKRSSLSKGFYYKSENTFYLSEADIFSERIKKTKKRKKTNTDLFAEQMSTLKIGDYVIHKTHGVGKYIGIENLALSDTENDFLIIEYLDGDKVYVPVYKLNLIQKHAEHKQTIRLDNLKTKKFEAIKSKAKNSVKKLAFDLLELQAKRRLKKGFKFSPPDHIFKEFELNFKFQETPDQLQAIDDVLDDMQSEKPMDRLVCGDVGFGKTEVAMRAAFKAVLDQKQVGVLVPTTVLAFQHFNTFIKRFENYPVNIEFISRFKTAKEIAQIKDKLKKGLIDILIGTHKILSDQVEFNDLGLLVIDEEQRFGVGHKEKLKLLKENVDTLVLTATPIPRTLQMSFLGIKELSLIQTAPPKRQSIKTYIIKEDFYTLKLAITKELSRGGQVFVVHNRVHDINEYAAQIKKLVPEASIVVAHGQMKERELEKHIKDFYEHKYDILVSTTIIESGIDIPSANTMIIDRADMYGLSQLHQLRGRIGRSDKKAYAYFIIPSNKNLSEVANKRLKALQTYADMGSGFSLATSDLEIRGSGDILGAEQSGHIANIGLELYMELLQDAINDIKGGQVSINKDIEIQTPFSSFIPTSYMSDHGTRLKYYKRLSNCYDFVQLDQIIEEIVDQYGQLPAPLKNLESILKSRVHLKNVGLSSIRVLSKTINLNFDKKELDQDEELKNRVINTFVHRPKVYKIKPNYSVICSFKEEISTEILIEFSKHIASQIDLC